MTLLYVDTSALFKRYVEEHDSEAVLARIDEAPAVGTAVITRVEVAARGRIAGSERGFSLAFKGDALWVRTRSEQAHTASGRLNGTTATVTRLRTALEGAKNITLSERMSLRTTVETGIRQDAGDAETGAGIEVGAGLALNDRASGLTVNVHMRTLVVHQAAGFREHGVAVSISYDPAPASRLGFSARVSPARRRDERSRRPLEPGNDERNGPAPAARQQRATAGHRARLRPPDRYTVRGYATRWIAHVRARPRLPGRLRDAGGTPARQAEPATRR